MKFYRQHPLFVDLDGRETFFVADFYCHECMVVIELDGKIHDYHKMHDEARAEVISTLGFQWCESKTKRSSTTWPEYWIG